jgi:oxaloacetate decarboxylase (Na+ extruding) subunit alpha
MDKIEFVDVTLRDGHQSLWAERMTTGMMLPVAERMDRAGFDAIELLSPSHLGKCVRELREDPFERIRRVAERVRKTPLRLNSGGLNVFGSDQPALYQLFWDLMARNGITEARISDSWNDPRMWHARASAAANAGVRPIINITYSISPRHTDEYFVERTRRAVALSPYRLCLKDPGGLLTPERTRTLVPLMLANAGGVPLELHTHCTTGLGPLCCLDAVQLGIRIVNTAIPPLADDASLPSIFNVAHNLRVLGYRTEVDEELLRPVAEHFTIVARREGLPIGAPVQYDYAQYVHQVPGGMISNLDHQLREVGAQNRMPEALQETVQVRADFGYPIMVTPLSQFVGSQAAINVIVGERYKNVTDQVIRYALGHFGGEVEELMDPNVRDRILDRPRARELAAIVRPVLSLEEIRRDLDAEGVSDEELLLRSLVRKEDIEATRAAGPAKEYITDSDPVVSLVEQLSRLADTDTIQVSRPGFSVTLRKNASAQ